MRTWTQNNKHFDIVQGDITKESVDAVVNAANEYLAGGGGVDGAIHRAAGQSLMDECRNIKPQRGGVRCPIGTAVLTSSGKLVAKHIIHTVGPVWQDGVCNEAKQLSNAHKSSLELANQHGLSSISFPAISCGIFRYPIHQAASIAVKAILEHLRGETSLELVRYVLFSDKDRMIFESALGKLGR
jgi:O-acetyl-ADP-ribose deacetylase